MSMLFDPVTRLLPADGKHFRAVACAIGHVADRTIEVIGRLCHAFTVNLMRRYVRQARHSVNDRRLTEGRHQAQRDRRVRHRADPATPMMQSSAALNSAR